MFSHTTPRPTHSDAGVAHMMEVLAEMSGAPHVEPKPAHDPRVGRTEAIYRAHNGWVRDRL